MKSPRIASVEIVSSLPPCGGSGLKYQMLHGLLLGDGSPSMRREWIEMTSSAGTQGTLGSPSMRREWIEIPGHRRESEMYYVSLHAEGVD